MKNLGTEAQTLVKSPQWSSRYGRENLRCWRQEMYISVKEMQNLATSNYKHLRKLEHSEKIKYINSRNRGRRRNPGQSHRKYFQESPRSEGVNSYYLAWLWVPCWLHSILLFLSQNSGHKLLSGMLDNWL